MDTGISSSLIPHESIVAARRIGGGGGLEDVVLFFSIIALVVSGGLAGAVFFYNQYTQNQIGAKEKSLEKERAALNQETIEHLTHLGAQIKNAEIILNQHLAPTLFFLH